MIDLSSSIGVQNIYNKCIQAQCSLIKFVLGRENTKVNWKKVVEKINKKFIRNYFS